MKFIGKYENLINDFEKNKEQFDLGEIPHFNPSGKQNWPLAYTPELLEKVYYRYRKDFDTGYPEARVELLEFLNSQDK